MAKDKSITEHLSFNLVPELKRAIQQDLVERTQKGESLTMTDWLQEAVIQKLKLENKDLIEQELFSLPEEWEEIKSLSLSEKQHLYNDEALEQLKKEKGRLAVETGLSGLLGLSAGFFNSIGFGLLALAYRPLFRLTQVSRVIQLMENLNKYDKDTEIKIFPSIPVPRTQPIDLLITFPEKSIIMILSIRSRTKAERRIKYEDSESSLYVRHDNKGLQQWSPCPLAELRNYEKWLTENNNWQRFQLSTSKLKNASIYKVLFLWSPAQLDKDNENFRFIFTNGKITASPLCVPEDDKKMFIVQQKEFDNFITLCLEGIIK